MGEGGIMTAKLTLGYSGVKQGHSDPPHSCRGNILLLQDKRQRYPQAPGSDIFYHKCTQRQDSISLCEVKIKHFLPAV